MKRFIEGVERTQSILFPAQLDEYVDEDNPVRIVDAFIDSLGLKALGFADPVPAELDYAPPGFMVPPLAGRS